MGKLGAKSDYESLRDARISENMARMEMLGLLRCAGELSDIASASSHRAAGSATPRRTPRPRVTSMTPLRRSGRLLAATRRCSARLNGQGTGVTAAGSEEEDDTWEDDKEGKRAMAVAKERVQALQERRCDSRGRGGVYDPVLGICCHFCRQKKLCGEEDCKRCGEGDLKQPCLGKTECSSCHSSNGILCRACLKVRYGEEMEEVRKNKNWMCPHCVEEKGIKKFWICNSKGARIRVSCAPSHGQAEATSFLTTTGFGTFTSTANSDDDDIEIVVIVSCLTMSGLACSLLQWFSDDGRDCSESPFSGSSDERHLSL